MTNTANDNPMVSATICRVRPATFFPSSQPRVARPPVSAARTDCESMTAADGATVWRSASLSSETGTCGDPISDP